MNGLRFPSVAKVSRQGNTAFTGDEDVASDRAWSAPASVARKARRFLNVILSPDNCRRCFTLYRSETFTLPD